VKCLEKGKAHLDAHCKSQGGKEKIIAESASAISPENAVVVSGAAQVAATADIRPFHLFYGENTPLCTNWFGLCVGRKELLSP